MQPDSNAWVVIGQDERGKLTTGLHREAILSLSSLSNDQMYAVEAVLQAGIMHISAQIGAEVEVKPMPVEIAQKVLQRDGLIFARKKLREARDNALKAIKGATE